MKTAAEAIARLHEGAGIVSAPGSAPTVAGKYDSGARRRAKRGGRERGCWAYIPAEELVRAGFDPAEPAPFYRMWGRRHSLNTGSVLIRLYREA